MSRDSERRLLTNLSVLSKVQAQDRLNVRGGMLHIISTQTPIVSSSIYRALTGNGRHCTVQTIERLYSQVVDLWHKQIGEGRNVMQLYTYITNSLTGFQHLIDVYSSDSTTVSRMEVVVQHVQTAIGTYVPENRHERIQTAHSSESAWDSINSQHTIQSGNAIIH